MDSEDEIPFQILREITDGFSKERKLGQGAFGVVYKGVTKNGDDVAVKRLLINSSLDFKHQLKNELYNLRKLNHPNIVHVLGYCFETEQKPFIMEDGSKVFVDETQGALCLEYMHNGSLQRLLSDEFSGLEWHTRFKIIKGTCEGLKYIHELEEPIYHLDLKPDNILLDKDMVPKIADFGLSRIIHNKEPTRITQNPYGTQGYQPREYIDSGEISGKFDIFSLGVIMIRVVSGPKGYPKCLDMCLDEFVDQVQRNWRNRLQATYSSGSLVEAYCHQVKTCIQLAWLCVEEDSKKRPNIGKITEKLNEIETAIGEFVHKPTEILQLPQKGCIKNVSGMTMHYNKNIDMRNKSTDVKGQHQNINLIGPSCSEPEFVDARQTSSDVVEELIVGRAEEKRKIIGSLLAGMSEKIIILPIYGIGGIGKTTLARLIYNDPNFKCYTHVWVDVSRRFDLNKICESTISQISGKESRANERKIVHSCLTKLLSGKKILIVLDDLWEDDQFHLQELKDMLYHADSNIIILVTTRSERVAGRICTNLQPYKILPLTNDMCWDIIKQRSAFEARDDKKQLTNIGREIAQKCGGVALAAQSLGFTLRSMNFNQWMNVKDNDIWNEPVSTDASLPNHVLASLKLSYSQMDLSLKKCFSYCAIFPKGHKIVKYDVIYQWISLDFIKPTKILSNLQLCEKYIARLLGLSFFQHSASPTGDREDDVAATVFTMHDLVHDLARSIMLFEIIDASKQCNTGGSRFQFALLNDCTKPLKSFTQYPTAVRALRFHGSDQNVLHGASFLSAKYLCVLDLNECSVQKLPKSIGNLKHLRYINAPRVEHRAIPNCITKLKKLIYLSLRGSYQILALPESIGELKGLMYLDLSGCSRLEKLPVSFGMLTKLVHLDMSGCSDVTGVSESLESLTNLEYLNLSHYRTLSTTKRQPPEALRRLTDLKYLNLSGSTFFIEDHGIIQALCSLTKLQCLNLSKCSLLVRDSHLTWISEAMRNLTELRYLDLSSCSTVSGADEALPIFLECISNLPNLEHLDLSNNRELTRVPDCICSLRKLHRLDLSYCYSLRSLPATLHEMDSLKFLHLHKLLKVPALNKNLITLPHFLVQADYHNSSSNLALLQDVNRTDLVISRLENVKSVQEARSVRLMEKGIKKMKLNWTRDSERFVEDMELLAELIPPITLEKLFIDGYSSVRFPEWFIGIADHLPNLCRISLSNLPKCNALPPLGQLPNLEELNFCGMSGISKIDGDLYGTRRPSFPRLKDFSLSGMESLEVWYTTYSHGGDGVSKFMFPNLQRLTICECPNLRQKPCPHRAEERWNIWGACDGVISSWEERASQTAASSPSSAP
ncbi:putative disease resistance protein RGA1 isoform X3 [Panicum hallii]|nr:putative disease resistance protein RGA1 isoform X3 [Panicum hallii]